MLLGILALVMLLRSGIWFIPNIGGSRLIAADPFVNPFDDPNAHALVWSWLGPFLAWLVGATGPAGFFLLHLAFTAVFVGVMLMLVWRRLPEREARAASLLFMVLPVSATALFWVGTDSLTLLLMAAAFVVPHPAWAMICGVALGTQHFEQAFFGFGALVAGLALARLWRVETAVSIGWAAAVLGGVALGKLLLIGLFAAFGMEVNSGRLFWLQEHLPMLLEQFLLHPHVVVWSVLGLGWVVLAQDSRPVPQRLPLLVPLAALLPLLVISGDQTRVLAIVTFPLIAAFWLLDADFLRRQDDRRLAVLLLLWLIVPWIWVWGGVPRWSALPYDLAYILHHASGWPPLPADIAGWPFRAE